MIIDIIFLILLAIAVLKGMSRGFIIAIFSFFAVIIGVVAAMKLSYLVAEKLEHVFTTGKQWLPFISFLIVLVGVVILVRLVANIIQRSIKMVALGFLDKAAGICLFILLYISVYSVILFYLTKMEIINASTINASRSYNFIEPFGPKIVDIIGAVVPVFKNLFQQLSDFFSNIAQHKV